MHRSTTDQKKGKRKIRSKKISFGFFFPFKISTHYLKSAQLLLGQKKTSKSTVFLDLNSANIANGFLSSSHFHILFHFGRIEACFPIVPGVAE
ncbi:hypothetical protein T08_9639 [Trichinella sp. T8]|nr:hypothetical protein T08_9639 [Trichinella sp. T8]